MKVAYTYNLRRSSNEKHATFYSQEAVDAVAQAIEEAGHEIECIPVTESSSAFVEKLESFDPDIVFSTAESKSGKLREAFFPTLFDDVGVPYCGSDAYTNTVTVDKNLTKLIALQHGIATPRSVLVTPSNVDRIKETGLGLALPVIIKPNYEGSSIGIGADSVIEELSVVQSALDKALRKFPDGVLVEEFVPGIDVSIGYIDRIGNDDGLLPPVEHFCESQENPFNIYDYHLKNIDPDGVQFRCPALIPRDVAARMRDAARRLLEVLEVRDVGRFDFRVAEDGRFYLLDVNTIPFLRASSPLFAATAQLGMTFNGTVAAILNAAALRMRVASARELGVRKQRRSNQPIRVGFTYNVKRETGDDEQAEWDPPETIIAISNALARQGHIVVHLEATPDLPRVLAEADVDLIFNIAEGVEGRNREAQVPALCELLGIPYTGSDSATLAIALDKALCKKVLMQHDILTPKYQLMETGRERLQPDLTFPLIVKPNAEGSSKGIGSTNVADTEEELRTAVRNLLDRYKQPVIIEEYISGREFTVGLLGDKRPKVLPAMEIVFHDKKVDRPVYDYTVKQEWEKHVSYECPAQLTESEKKAIEKVARATFFALDCRDVARVDLRMDEQGQVYVLEVNPLPGLTPDYSDLVLITNGLGWDYDQLMGEIMMGGLKRLKAKRKRAEKQQALAAAEENEKNNGGRKNGTSKRNIRQESGAVDTGVSTVTH